MSSAPKLDPGATITVGVHDGRMHADEVFATTALKFLVKDVLIVRTRDEEKLKSCDFRIDVGGRYDPTTCDFDHHMASFNTRHKAPRPKVNHLTGQKREWTKGPLRSGFGLIWLHYGKDVVDKVLSLVYPKEFIQSLRPIDRIDIWSSLDDGLVSAIDANDNGEGKEFDMELSPFRTSDASKYIADLNPTTTATINADYERIKELETEAFLAGMSFAKTVLMNNITSQAEMIYYRARFMELLLHMDPDDHILVMEKYIPWAGAYARAGNQTNGVDMVVYPTNNGSWMCQSPKYYVKRDQFTCSATMSDGSRRELKHPAPLEIRGLRDEELVKKTGIPDVTFVHTSGHLGGAKTKEAAIQLAKYFIAHEYR